MADQLVASTIGVLLEMAVSVAADRISLVLGFRKDLEALQKLAKDIHAVLADAEIKRSQNPIVLCWLRKVEAAAFEAENVLDELLYESLRRQVKSRDEVKKAAKVCLFFSLSKHDLSFRWRMGYKVREINLKFEKFMSEAPEIGLVSMVDSMCRVGTMIGRQTNSLPLQFVAGRDDEICEIVAKLLSASSSASISAIAIVGMGGLGKTTLAKSIYNYPTVVNHFGHKMWVCVSDKFEATELFGLILESLEGRKIEKCSSQDAIVQKIKEKLGGKRFLLVLDDVWNENQTSWNDFFTSLGGLNIASGSCCLVTTRLQTTAKIVTSSPFVLGRLADDDCWYILCRKATKDEEMPQELDAHKDHVLKRCQELHGFKKQILEKCRGLPLAANLVGGLLSLQKREKWVSIVKNKILEVSDDVKGEITPILKLSFDFLPSPIKKCFAYCSIYCKDTTMKSGELIELWMSEGFLQEDVESRLELEEIGEDYLIVLLQSSLLEKVEAEWWEKEDSYQMHDLVHDLAESVSKRKQIDGEVRHLALTSDSIEYNTRSTFLRLALASDNIKYNTRSSLVQIVKEEISDKVLLRFQHLRTLNLCGIKTENLPNGIGKLKHLHYLDVSCSEIKVLPDALCKLYNLQTLNLDECSSLQCLPRGLSELISLRHLHFVPKDWNKMSREFKMPPNLGRLTCLQTLNYFSVRAEKGHEIKELGCMKNLAGEIRISNLELVKGEEGARLAYLSEKKKLVTLELCWGSTDRGDNGNCNDENVLEGLEPHPNLKRLGLRRFMGDQIPQWFGKLKVLNGLSLVDCKSLKDLPTLGHLPHLTSFKIEGLEHVTSIAESFYRTGGLWEGKVFPSLEFMGLKKMPNLKEWKGLEAVNGVVFPKLEGLLIRDCCQLASVPSPFPSLKNLFIEGSIQVAVVRDIIGKGPSLLKKLYIGSMGGLSSLGDVIATRLTCLEWFVVRNCDNLVDIPSSTLEACKSLETLIIQRCSKLKPRALNLQHTPSLTELRLQCSNMFTTSVMPTGFRYLANLETLAIGPFATDSIQSFDWSGLRACSSTLTTLSWFGSFPKYSCLPQHLQQLTSLRHLNLTDLDTEEALPDWLGNLTSLVELKLHDCPMLQGLPSALAMRHMTNLRDLEICKCPLVPERSVQDVSSALPNLQISQQESCLLCEIK